MDVARGPIEYPGPAHPTDDWVAITEYELREVAEHMPGGRAVPVQVRGFDADQVLVLQANGSGGLPALVALARLRTAITGPTPQEPQSDAQGPNYAQECATTDPLTGATTDPLTERVAEGLQVLFEGFLHRSGIDPQKVDHQNVAGDLADDVLRVLRAAELLPERSATDPVAALRDTSESPYVYSRPVDTARVARDHYLSHRQDVRAAVARGLGQSASPTPVDALAVTGRRIMAELDSLMEVGR